MAKQPHQTSINGYTPPYKITSKILNLVSSISEVIGKLEVLEPKAISPNLRKINKIKTIAGTLAIEGNFLGEEKITSILEGKRVLGEVREIAEVQGAIKVYDELKNFDYSNIEHLLKSHQILMNEILLNTGTFRNVNVKVAEHIAPPPIQVPTLMNNLFEWLKNSDIHPLIKSSVFHYEFEFIHPFYDGNGRVGRLWQTLILYNWKNIFSAIPLESVIKIHQEEYYKALELSSSLGKSTPFIEFMLAVIFETCNKTLEEIENVPKNVPKNVPLKRAENIVNLIKLNKDITIEQLALECKVNSKTIKRDIAKLKKDGKLQRIGSLKSGYWEIVAND